MDCEPEWVKKAQQGDHDAYDELVRRYRPRILVYCQRLLNNHIECDDVTQEVITKGWTKIATFRCDSPFEHWLNRIATRTCLNFARKRRSKGEAAITVIATIEDQGDASTLNPSDTMEAALEMADYADYLRNKIRHHAKNARPPWDHLDWQIFHLRFEQNVETLREVATRVSRNENMVKYRFYRRICPVLEKVRAELENERGE